MRFAIFALFLLLAVVFGKAFDFNLGFAFAEEEEEEEVAGWKCYKYPYSRWGDQNACEFTCKAACTWVAN